MAVTHLETRPAPGREDTPESDGSAALAVWPVESRRDLNAFLEFPRHLYRGDPHYAPPHRPTLRGLLTPGSSPFLEHTDQQLFLAYRHGRHGRHGRIVGRIAAFHDRRRTVAQDAWVGEFGLFECENDREAAAALFQAAHRFLEKRGIRSMVGPINLSTNLDCGLLVESDGTAPWTMMPHNPPWYRHLLEDAAGRKEVDLLVYRLHRDDDAGRLRAVAQRARRKTGVEIRPLDRRRYPEQMEIFSRLYNRCWEHNRGFVPLTSAEVDFFIDEFRPILDAGLVRIAYVGGEPAGFSLALPDIHPVLRALDRYPGPLGLLAALVQAKTRHPRHARLMTLGVLPEQRRSGLTGALLIDTLEAAWDRGYRQMEFSWMLEDNHDALGYLDKLGASRTHRYRLYRLGDSEAPSSAKL